MTPCSQLSFNDASEENIASIFRVVEVSLAKTSKQNSEEVSAQEFYSVGHLLACWFLLNLFFRP
jgi:hypothetical protein